MPDGGALGPSAPPLALPLIEFKFNVYIVFTVQCTALIFVHLEIINFLHDAQNFL